MWVCHRYEGISLYVCTHAPSVFYRRNKEDVLLSLHLKNVFKKQFIIIIRFIVIYNEAYVQHLNIKSELHVFVISIWLWHLRNQSQTYRWIIFSRWIWIRNVVDNVMNMLSCCYCCQIFSESIHLKKSKVLPVTMSHFVLLTGSSINVYVYIWMNILIYKERETNYLRTLTIKVSKSNWILK